MANPSSFAKMFKGSNIKPDFFHVVRGRRTMTKAMAMALNKNNIMRVDVMERQKEADRKKARERNAAKVRQIEEEERRRAEKWRRLAEGEVNLSPPQSPIPIPNSPSDSLTCPSPPPITRISPLHPQSPPPPTTPSTPQALFPIFAKKTRGEAVRSQSTGL